MATNLSGSITDTDNIIYPTNDDVLTGERPYRVVIESEVLHVRAAEYIGSASEATRWTVDRGQEGTTAASHAAGTAVTAAGAYGAGGGGGVTVDNQSDPPAAVTTLIAPGADVSIPGAATLAGIQLRRLGPLALDAASFDIDHMAQLWTLAAGTILMEVWAEVTVAGWGSDLTIGTENFPQAVSVFQVGAADALEVVEDGYSHGQRTGPQLAVSHDIGCACRGRTVPGRCVTEVVLFSTCITPGTGEADLYALIAEPAA